MLKRVFLAAVGFSLVSVAQADTPQDLMSVYTTLASKRFVDLTHSFGVSTPHWKGFGE